VIIFDVETGPLPDEQLRPLIPAFDASEVKCGNLKDPEKIAAKIAEARELHEQEFIGRAALSAITGRVLAVGYQSIENGRVVIDDGKGEERTLLANFWQRYEKSRAERRRMVGHNCLLFDVPFLMRRSWTLDVTVPATVLDKGRWLDTSVFGDTMSLWAAGGRDFVKLDLLARAFGVGAKTEGVDGGDFSRLWNGTPEERAKAVEYLQNDLAITAKVAVKMGLA